MRLYDETKRILTHKVCTATLDAHCGAGCQDVKEECTISSSFLPLLQVKDFDPDTKFL